MAGTTIGFGGPRIDGPPPITPLYGLVQSAAVPSAGVRIVPDVDDGGVERWGNGVTVLPYPPGMGDAFDACAPSSTFEEKADGSDVDLPNPEFAAMAVYLPVWCKAQGIWNHDDFKARAVASFSAVESAIVANEFMRGLRLASQPYLADGEGVYPLGDTATSVRNGFTVLEEEIAKTGRGGVIHASPSVVSALGGLGLAELNSGVLRTLVGTLVVPDAGYAGGSTPVGHPEGEWMYASGPVDIRRSAVSVLPDRPSEAVDRTNNVVVYRVERYYLVDWDTVLQAAVNVDVCKATC